MPRRSSKPIDSASLRARRDRITRLARRLGFVGRVEYRHVYSQTGGASYGRGSIPSEDLLTVYGEAFERDADPDDFSLEAMLAHECGHQLLARHPRIAKLVGDQLSLASEEILASLLGSMLCPLEKDRDDLMRKAVAELMEHGEPLNSAVRRLQELRNMLEAFK